MKMDILQLSNSESVQHRQKHNNKNTNLLDKICWFLTSNVCTTHGSERTDVGVCGKSLYLLLNLSVNLELPCKPVNQKTKHTANSAQLIPGFEEAIEECCLSLRPARDTQ